jgi:methionine-rich copper-binding protein CopC
MMQKRNAVVWALVLVVASVAVATAHLRVQKSMPEADAILAASPDHVQVWFSQAPDPAISRLTLEGADGEIAVGATTVHDDRSLKAMLPSALAGGDYTVKWRTAGDDGHTQRGDFAFTVLAAD